MTAQTATYVRFVGRAVNIDHGAIGRIERMHHVLTNCPVVYFPTGTFGPYATFVITRPTVDLEVLDAAQVEVSDSGRYSLREDDNEPCVNCTNDLRDHDAEQFRTCEREHLAHL
jgi:hypothetical protein